MKATTSYPFFLFGTMLLLISMSGCQPAEAAATPSPTASLTLAPTPTLTPTPTATATATPTPEIIMHAGIPVTIEQCDILHPNTSGYDEDMRKRREVDREALGRLNGDIGYWTDFTRITYPNLPLPDLRYVVPTSMILSCSTYERGGERVIRFGIATSPDTMMYIDYDEAAARDFVTGNWGETGWDQYYSFETLFAKIANGEDVRPNFKVFFDQSGAPFDRPGEFGFEGVYEFFDTPLSESFVIRSNKGSDTTIANFADLAFVSHDLSRYDLESQHRILIELEKYVWPGSIVEF
jgi:hypothetical protein